MVKVWGLGLRIWNEVFGLWCAGFGVWGMGVRYQEATLARARLQGPPRLLGELGGEDRITHI